MLIVIMDFTEIIVKSFIGLRLTDRSGNPSMICILLFSELHCIGVRFSLESKESGISFKLLCRI
jgi:hypothetical protein